MNKDQAIQLIKKVFQNEFNYDFFIEFIINLLKKVDMEERIKNREWSQGTYIYPDYQEYIKRYKRLGLYTSPKGEELEILIIEVKSVSKLDRARTSLRNFVVKYLQSETNKSKARDYALAAFYSKEDNGADWRFSFIKIEHETYQDDKGKVKTRKDFSPAKRFSYLVGKNENCYTAQKQFLPLLEMDYADPVINDIERAFSIETVTNDFFKQYKGLYYSLLDYIDSNPIVKKILDIEEIGIERFIKKLLGQIVFLYFLQKKGWLGVPKELKWGQGEKNFLRKLFEKAQEEKKEFYRHYLQYLFYEALATERKDSLYQGYYSRFDCKIPFLNGGLFEADYNWQISPISIPNDLFDNNEKNDMGDYGKGILDVFDRYNFTVKEDEPLEKEVAVDPEMLGKIFENMLETDERKNIGAFYTPREIVHYMCQESLIYYLDNAVNYDKTLCPIEDIELFIRKGIYMIENDSTALVKEGKIYKKEQHKTIYHVQLPQSIRKHASLLDEVLIDVKICDPAIGSGAFPVGLLTEIVNARIVLQPFLEEKNTDIILTPYDMKRHAIRESIYGVDKDASAIDIARLRLWLSLIVDEDNYEKIEALPNLDFKIVQGDSLIGINANLFNKNYFKEIEVKKKEFFNTTRRSEKKKLHEEIVQLITKISDGKKNFDFELYFSEVWRDKKGFDIVIGNPPYVQIQKFSGTQIQKDWENQKYETFAKTGDIYCLFYEKGNRILREGGILTFITSNKWMRTNYGLNTRKYFTKYTIPIKLIDFGGYKVFDSATVDTNILIFEKKRKERKTMACTISKDFSRQTDIAGYFGENHIILDNLSEDNWLIMTEKEYKIKKRIEDTGIPLKKWNISIYRGILTGFNEAFIIDRNKRDELIASDPKNEELIKPLLRGRDIKRYKTDFANLWLIATLPARNLNIENYPVIRDYLKSFGKKLDQTGKLFIGQDGKTQKSRKLTSNKWFETQDQIAYYKEFYNEKIIYPDIAQSLTFDLDKKGMFMNNTCYMLNFGDQNKYALAVLNSKISDWHFKWISAQLGEQAVRHFNIYIEKLPIPIISKESQKPFEILVDYIHLTKQSDQKLQSAYFEQIIDGLVFELYFLMELKSASIEIAKHLKDLKSIPDTLSENEKLEIIRSEFDRLYNPYHPVRNHIESLNHLEFVRIIKGIEK